PRPCGTAGGTCGGRRTAAPPHGLRPRRRRRRAGPPRRAARARRCRPCVQPTGSAPMRPTEIRGMLDPMDMPPPLEALPEDWSRALAIVAHPDDMEFGSAAAVARWTGQGKKVVYCMVTSGEAGIDGMAPDESRRVREAEQVESARIVGVDQVDFLGLPDGILEYGVALRRAICEEVRLHRPEIVITNNFRDGW